MKKPKRTIAERIKELERMEQTAVLREEFRMLHADTKTAHHQRCLIDALASAGAMVENLNKQIAIVEDPEPTLEELISRDKGST